MPKRSTVRPNTEGRIFRDIIEMKRCYDEEQSNERGRRGAQHYIEVAPQLVQMCVFHMIPPQPWNRTAQIKSLEGVVWGSSSNFKRAPTTAEDNTYPI
jgi:hypothetical protein